MPSKTERDTDQSANDLARWFELLPVTNQVAYVRGVPHRVKMVQIQPKGDIGPLRNRPAQFLSIDAGWHWVRMREAAKADGIELIAYSAFRSHNYQQILYDQWKDGKRRLRPAVPGWSLHESGNAVDVLRSHDDPDAGGPLVGPTDSWLAEHAAEFGFFRTVPRELWHYEFRQLNV